MTSKQKRIAGIFTLLIVIPIQLLFLLALIYVLITSDEGRMETVTSFLLSIALFCFPAWWGLRLWKEGTAKQPTRDDIDPLTAVQVQAKVGIAEYRKLIFRMSYTSPAFLFIHLIGVVMLGDYLVNGGSPYLVLFIFLFILSMPVIIYLTANANYKSTKSLNELITYRFTLDGITVTGDTFNTTLQWQTLYKVKEYNDWFLLYTSKQVALVVPKRSFASETDKETFRKLSATPG